MIDISIVGPLKFTCMRRSRASMHFCSSVLSSFALCLWTQEFQANMKVIRGLLWKPVFRSNFIVILTNCKKVAYYKLNHIWLFSMVPINAPLRLHSAVLYCTVITDMISRHIHPLKNSKRISHWNHHCLHVVWSVCIQSVSLFAVT